MFDFEKDYDKLYKFVATKYFGKTELYAQFFEKDFPKVLRNDVFEKIFSKIDLTKSPGSPLVFQHPTNRTLPNIFGEMKGVLERRLHKLEKCGEVVWRNKEFTSSIESHIRHSVNLLNRGFSDPVLVGFKGEPRPIKPDGTKKRPRLICQVSVNMNLAARAIIGNHLNEEQLHSKLPTVTQWDINTQERTEEFRKELESYGELSSNDVEGWEYSVNESDRWAACFKEAICMGLIDKDKNITPGKERHFFALIGYYFCMIHRVVQLPDGTLVVTKPGEMSSGELSTFSNNSFIRSYLSECVSIQATGKSVEFVKSAGDDCMDTNPQVDEIYLKYGKVITDHVRSKGTYNFCSTTFTPGGSYQDNIEKSFYSVLVNRKFDLDVERNFISSFKLHPRFKELYGCLCDRFPRPGN